MDGLYSLPTAPTPPLLPAPRVTPNVYNEQPLQVRSPRIFQVELGAFVLLFILFAGTHIVNLAIPGFFPSFLFPGTPSGSEAPLVARIQDALAPTPEPSPTPEPTPIQSLVPRTFYIPRLKLEAPVEQVGVTEDGRMEVPKQAGNVAWYKWGPKPREYGNAVVTGHYDTPSGKPAVFYNLRKLEQGDEIVIESRDGITSTFMVTGKETIAYTEFPSEYVFALREGINLNLITCDGIWNAEDKIYSNRLVVYATLKELSMR